MKKLNDAVDKEVAKNTKFNMLNTKVNMLLRKIPDATTLIPDHAKYIFTQKFNALTAGNFSARLK